MSWSSGSVTKGVSNLLSTTQSRMHGALVHLGSAFAALRTGRARSGLIDELKVEYHGAQVRLMEIASISVPEPRLLVVRPFDPNDLPAIEKAIQRGHVGLTPQRSGGLIRLPVPPLTGERRAALGEEASALAEEQRVAVRNIRRDALREIDFAGLPEDTAKFLEREIGALSERYHVEILQTLKAKLEDLLDTANRIEFGSKSKKKRKDRLDSPWNRPKDDDHSGCFG